MDRYDLVILGSGSTAFAAALRAAQLGKAAAMTESRALGGTCVNRGCLPSKNLIEAAKLFHDARHSRYPGIEPVTPGLRFADLIAQKREVVEGYREHKYKGLLSKAIVVVEGRAKVIDPHTVLVGDRRLFGAHLLVALGSRPVVPDMPGLADVPFLTSDLLAAGEGGELTELPRSLIILGAGYIALELGQMFRRFGTEVTLVERSEQLLARYEPEIDEAIARVLRDEGVRIETGASVDHVERDGSGVRVVATRSGERKELLAERLLVATGRRPNTDGVGLDEIGVRRTDGGAIVVDEFLRTSVDGVWAAGDAIGSQHGSQLATPLGARQGGIVAQNAFGDVSARRTVGHRVVPRAVFTDPQIAVVGVTEREAIARGHRCWCATIPMSLVPRAGAVRDTRGLVKMVADAETNEVLGVSMLGVNAGEVIHEAAMGMRFRAKLDDFIDLLHVYPTMAEALKIVAIARYKDPAKLSCCAD